LYQSKSKNTKGRIGKDKTKKQPAIVNYIQNRLHHSQKEDDTYIVNLLNAIKRKFNLYNTNNKHIKY